MRVIVDRSTRRGQDLTLRLCALNGELADPLLRRSFPAGSLSVHSQVRGYFPVPVVDCW
jgi:hypothetical protein